MPEKAGNGVGPVGKSATSSGKCFSHNPAWSCPKSYIFDTQAPLLPVTDGGLSDIWLCGSSRRQHNRLERLAPMPVVPEKRLVSTATLLAIAITTAARFTSGAIGALAFSAFRFPLAAVHAVGTTMPAVHAVGATMPAVHAVGATMPAVNAFGAAMPTVHAVGATMPTVHAVAVGAVVPTVHAVAFMAVVMTVVTTARMPTHATGSVTRALQAMSMTVACVRRRATTTNAVGTRRSTRKRLPLGYGRFRRQGGQEVDRITQGIITIYRLITIITVDGITILVVRLPA